MHRQLKALDLFCGAGGVCAGLQRAGFYVVGIDIEPQPNYPGTFIQANALSPPVNLGTYDFIWASPPCQGYTQLLTFWGKDTDYMRAQHPDLISATRELLKPYPYTCIENVPNAPVRKDLELTLPMLQENRHTRKRHFELSFPVPQPPPAHAPPNLSLIHI